MSFAKFDGSTLEERAEVRDGVFDVLSPNWAQPQNRDISNELSVPARRRAAVYMRYSTDGQDAYSFQRQLTSAREYANKINADIVKVYGDAGKSGAYTANRPSFQDMFAEAANRGFDVVIIEEGDRLSRKLHIMATAFSRLAQLGIELHSSKHGRWSLMHCAFAGLMSDDQRTRIYELTRSGIVKILDRGLWPGTAPFGFKKIPGKPGEMQIDPDQARVVRRIYELYRSGLKIHTIYTILKKENVPPPKSSWYKNAIKYILKNPIYVGAVIFFRTKYERIEKDETTIITTITKRPPAEWHYAERPDWRIVDLQTWQEVQALRSAASQKGPTPAYLLSRLVFCGECGRRMHIGSHSGGRHYFRCTTNWAIAHTASKSQRCNQRHVTVDTLEEAIVDVVAQKLNAPDALKKMQAGYDGRISLKSKKFDGERLRLHKERTGISARLDATYDDAMNVGLTTKAVAEQRQTLCARMEAIDRRTAELPHVILSTVPFLEAPIDGPAFIGELRTKRNYRNCDASGARVLTVFQALIEKVIVETDWDTRQVNVEIKGPISFADGGSELKLSFPTQHKKRYRDKLSSAIASKDINVLSDSDWDKLKGKLHDAPIWVYGYDQPIGLRQVLDALIFRKRTHLGKFSIPDAFGPPRQVIAAAQVLTYGGILDIVQTLIREENIEIAKGLDLNLDNIRSPEENSWEQHLARNNRRKMRILNSKKAEHL